jgi:hypothetical protein
MNHEVSILIDSSIEGMSTYFVWLNRGKESVALDLKAKEDLAPCTGLSRRRIFSSRISPLAQSIVSGFPEWL